MMNSDSDNQSSLLDKTPNLASKDSSLLQGADKLTKESATEILFEAAGGFGYLQMFAFLCVQCAISANNFWNNGLGFLI